MHHSTLFEIKSNIFWKQVMTVSQLQGQESFLKSSRFFFTKSKSKFKSEVKLDSLST